MAFRLSRIPDDLPLGQRALDFLEERYGLLRAEEAPALAVRILDDLGDFISYALDPGFGTVRYAERIASSRAEYGPVSGAADSGYLMREFYRPWLREAFRAAGTAPDLVLLTIPFPGCLVGAVAAAREARSAFGPAVRIAAGGGYVSTELRSVADASVFDDFDFLCFDAGYGALASLIEGREAESRGQEAPAPWRTARRSSGGAVEYFCVDSVAAPAGRFRASPPLPGRGPVLRPRGGGPPHHLPGLPQRGFRRVRARPLLRRIPCTGSGPTPPGSSTSWPTAVTGTAAPSATPGWTMSGITCPRSPGP